jgi:ribosomal protein S18 acetylase RimI-like enzyme
VLLRSSAHHGEATLAARGGRLSGVDPGWLRAAYADAWETHGRYREPRGGGVARLPGIRLMASGLPHPQWNSADVFAPALVDVDAVREWYDAKNVPWGVRVAAGTRWTNGRFLFTKRLMGLTPEQFHPVPAPADVTLRTATSADADAVVAVDAEAFEQPEELQRPWVVPILAQPSAVVCVAEYDGVIIGSGHCVLTDGDAGPAAYVAGIGVARRARRRGVGTAISSWLVAGGFDRGARLAHLNPDTDEASRVYERLGFTEVPGFDLYVDV